MPEAIPKIMKAVWYEANGDAADVLVHGEMPVPQPAVGEVLVRLGASGVNPSDVKAHQNFTGCRLRHRHLAMDQHIRRVTIRLVPNSFHHFRDCLRHRSNSGHRRTARYMLVALLAA